MKKIQMSVLVVEDEPIILKHICKKIEEFDIGIKVIATALNGKEALKKLYDFHPDFIITDIRMPLMDGIELIKHVRGMLPDMPVIVLSGYSDYEYMHDCIDLSVDGYILKPLNVDDLKKVLLKVKDTICEKQMKLTKEILTSSVMLGKENSVMPSGLDQEHFQLMMFNVGNAAYRMLNSVQVHMLSKIWEQIPWKAILEDMLPAGCECWIIDEYLYNQKFVLFTCGDRPERVHRYAQTLQRKLLKYTDELPVTIIYDAKAIEYSRIKEQADRLRNMIREYLCPCCSQIIVADDKERHENVPVQNELLYLGTGNLEDQEREFIKIGMNWNAAHVTQEGILKNIRSFLEKLAGDFSFYNVNIRLLIEQIEDVFVLESDMEELYKKIWTVICSSLETDNRNIRNSRDIAENLRKYFEEHYKEEVKLTKLSQEFHFSGAYLSKIFKKYTGETPVKYLVKIRMEHARKMLAFDGDMSVQTIAQNVGYDNVHYFSRVFKNETGMTPSEYREKVKKNVPV